MTATLVLGLMGVLGAGAGQGTHDVGAGLSAAVRRAPAGPLFQIAQGELVGTDPAPSVRLGTERSPHQPDAKVVCGLTILPADPGTDPKMVVQVPDQDTTFTMRKVTPGMCWDGTAQKGER